MHLLTAVSKNLVQSVVMASTSETNNELQLHTNVLLNDNFGSQERYFNKVSKRCIGTRDTAEYTTFLERISHSLCSINIFKKYKK